MPKFLNNVDLNKNELQNAKLHGLANAPGSPVEGQIYFDTTNGDKHAYIWDGTTWQSMSGPFFNSDIASNASISYSKLNLSNSIVAGDLTTGSVTSDAILDGTIVNADINNNAAIAFEKLASPTQAFSFNSQKITSLGTPTNPTDAANKAYVDAARSGLDVKASVRAATTPTDGNITLSGTQTIDTNVALQVGDRVLVKNQSTASENGIWIVSSSVWSRATDANGTADTGVVSGGTFTFVEEGFLNADSGWVVSSNGVINVGTDAMNWVQFSGAGQITAGDGLTKDGNTLHVNDDDVTIYVDGNDDLAVKSSATAKQVLVSQGSGTAVWEALDVGASAAVTGILPVEHGGTGGATAADAKTNLGFMTRYAANFGNGAATDYTITHNLGTRDITYTLYENASGYPVVFTDVEITDTNSITIRCSVAPTTNQYRAVIIG